MSDSPFDVGVSFPTTEIGTDAGVIRDFAHAVEDMGYTFLSTLDRVLGVNPANRPDWAKISPYTHRSVIQEPLMLFSYLAGVTRSIKLMTGIIVLPQRQTLLFAKQAANLDHYCGGRLLLGVGIGQNPVEYAAMGIPYSTRAARMEDQIHFLRRLWTEPWFSETSEFHEIVEAGLNPLPIQRPIPVWISAHAAAGIERAAHISDGLLCFLDANQAEETVSGFAERVKKHGRDPKQIGVLNIVLPATFKEGKRAPEDVVSCVATWRKAGARAVQINAMDIRLGDVNRHVDYLRKVAEMLRLRRKG